ncbi:MAG TPA: thiosulfate oxidation carrier protein SoxY [Burkholderiales bacterium]|jgi:sulfur-oxidizing protein SoxY|nr:thiosulfate oxidation carrier protein SoxY [Burkholderiales bacterium]
MNSIRRALVAVFVLGLVRPLAALAAWNKEAFSAKSAGDALKNLGIANAQPSKDLTVEIPEIAENGAVVPIEISSTIPGTTALIVVIDKNPFPLITRFDFKEGALPFVKLNAKVGETSDVRVLAEAAGKYYVTTREVKVTIGGCGG